MEENNKKQQIINEAVEAIKELYEIMGELATVEELEKELSKVKLSIKMYKAAINAALEEDE